MIYYFPGNESTYQSLKELGYTELPCQTDDRELIEVNTETKEFEIVHKHIPESYSLVSEFSTVLFEPTN